MANFDTMIENSIIGMSENYFKLFISQSIKEPDKVGSAKDMFEKMGFL